MPSPARLLTFLVFPCVYAVTYKQSSRPRNPFTASTSSHRNRLGHYRNDRRRPVNDFEHGALEDGKTLWEGAVCNDLGFVTGQWRRAVKVAVDEFRHARRKRRHKKVFDGEVNVLLVGSSNYRNTVSVFADLLGQKPTDWLDPIGPNNASTQKLVRTKKGSVLANFMGLDFSNPHYRFAYPVSYLQRSEPNARMRHDAVKICNQLGGPRDCKVCRPNWAQ
eukprot:1193888-Prorocentrum_minimum.AAC.1